MAQKKVDSEGIIREARHIGGWLKLLGIAKIVQGALLIITIVGALPGALSVWEGLLLNRASNGSMKVSTGKLGIMDKEMLKPLRVYLIIQVVIAVLLVGGFILGISMFALFGTSSFSHILEVFKNF
ncbi:hypothetical protein JW879_00445 [candidate division WOR-3 bacterium]|nr:hypothetical protein [candidate division WOR-3 bacterium]